MNAAAHQWTAALATGVVLHSREVERGEATAWPLAGGGLAALLTKLPDVLEPAVHPNHRQFFHSVAFAALVATGWKALHGWQPQSDDARFWRKVGMVGAGAYQYLHGRQWHGWSYVGVHFERPTAADRRWSFERLCLTEYHNVVMVRA